MGLQWTGGGLNGYEGIRLCAKLADTGSYARAAQELFITKQGLASAIERLERSMGVPLFEADRKGVRLTEYGHVFCSFSRMFEERHRAMMDEIEQMRRREERAVTLAASTGFVQRDNPGGHLRIFRKERMGSSRQDPPGRARSRLRDDAIGEGMRFRALEQSDLQ